MTSLVADEAVLALLRQVKEVAEVRDKDGQLIGLFTPLTVEQAQHYTEARPPKNPAEAQGGAQDKQPGRTTKEVLQRLQGLTADEPMRSYLQQLVEKLEERDRCATP